MSTSAHPRELPSENETYDLVVVGGGITGAGVAREAAASGLRTLLVEQKDFAWGTSSRSSKMVHGGLRYLGSGQIGLTRDAVRERQRLMAEAPGLVDPLPFAMVHFKGRFPGPRLFQILLRLYDQLAGTRSRRFLSAAQCQQWLPGLSNHQLEGASVFTDAVTDDARLVLRLIRQAQSDGARCLNYVRARRILRTDGHVSGIELEDTETGQTTAIQTPLVINATGAWAAELQQQDAPRDPLHIRPLRGSHLVVPWQRLPVAFSVSFLHPDDGRPVFAFPWQGTTVLGTTDLDHPTPLNQEPVITPEEVQYLLKIAGALFPSAGLKQDDVISTWAGVRPVVTDGSGKAPSKENREHALRSDNGLVSISGGKLTTFRRIAREALTVGLGEQGAHKLRADAQPVFTGSATSPRPTSLSQLNWRRLQGYFGADLDDLLALDSATAVPGTQVLWAELQWACRSEQVVHLDDLLLRRTRLGLILPDGGRRLLADIRAHCQPHLAWSDARWQEEIQRYLGLYQRAYSLPEPGAR